MLRIAFGADPSYCPGFARAGDVGAARELTLEKQRHQDLWLDERWIQRETFNRRRSQASPRLRRPALYGRARPGVLYIERQPDTVEADHFDWGFRVANLYGIDYRFTLQKESSAAGC